MRNWYYLFALLLFAAGCRESAPPANGTGPANGTAVSQGKAGAVSIEFWHTQTKANAKALDALVEQFNKSHPDVQVRALFQGSYDALDQKTKAAIVAKRPPDMAVAYESMVAEYMKAGVVLPLDDYLKGPDGLDAQSQADILPAYLASNRFPEFGSQLLSFPFTKSVLVLYCNLQALKEAGFSGPPKTWDEFRQAAIKTTKRDGDKITRYGFGVWPDASTIAGYILSQGGKLLSDDRKTVAFNDAAGRRAFALMGDLAKAGAADRTTKEQYAAEFGSGRIAMFVGSSTARETVIPAVAGKFPWSISVIPQADAAKPVTIQYGANVVIFKTTPEKEKAAWKFVRWLTDTDQTTYWATHSTYMPIRKSAASRPEMQAYWQKDPQAKQAFEAATYGVVEANVRGWQDSRKILEAAFDQVISGQKTPEEALREAETKANAALKVKQ